jgi:hypothetical protein
MVKPQNRAFREQTCADTPRNNVPRLMFLLDFHHDIRYLFHGL